ncbi:uncharacterized protein LOC124437927 [Xenia sp. Carnegie-2017]|uniref:uncharacterized protein LOC124437927 n=1 Tax=Xenia sp. Carnegie-2017 TaxID=2897299 RepID=UPI001F037F1C|nr:uncharacterized protein LOC124437927 [Xenia sp. Carnegie-2017]
MDPITISLGVIGILQSGKTLLELLGVVEGELTILKSICRQDLDSSISHFNKGIERLKLAESTENEKFELKEERKQLAKESFTQADREASLAFHNASLKIEERIIACRICIASSILRHFNDSEAAEKDAMVYLKYLNSLHEVEKLFSFPQLTFNKDQRDKNIENVLMMNLLLANFISNNTFIKRAVLDWPLIQSGVHKFHPLYFKDVEGITRSSTPWYESHFCKDEAHLFVDKEITITNEGEVLIFSGKNLQKVNSETGKLQPWCKESCEIDDWQVRCMTVDNNGVVYVLSGYGNKNTWNYQLTVFSEDGAIQQSTLMFLDNKDARNLFMAITNDEVVAIAFVEGDQPNINLCVCYKTGFLFLEPCRIIGINNPLVDELKSLCFSADRQIAMITYRHPREYYRILFYNMEADLSDCMKFKPSLDEIKEYDQVIYTPLSKCITCYFFNKDASKLLIETFSTETKKLQSSLVLMKAVYDLGLFNGSFRVVYHDNGGVALVTKECIVHLTKNLEENPSQNRVFMDRNEPGLSSATKKPDTNHNVRAYSVKVRKKSERKNEDSSEQKLEKSFSEGSHFKTLKELEKS